MGFHELVKDVYFRVWFKRSTSFSYTDFHHVSWYPNVLGGMT